MNRVNEVFGKIDELNEKFIKVWEDVCNIESPTSYKEADGITINCGLIEGGTTFNTVAEKCTFAADVRFSCEKEEKEVRRFCEEIAKKTYIDGCKCTLSDKSYRAAMERNQQNFDLLDKMNEIFRSVDLIPLEAQMRPAGSDAAYTSIAKIPSIDSIGVIGGQIHSKDEFAYLDSLAKSAKYLAAVAMCL